MLSSATDNGASALGIPNGESTFMVDEFGRPKERWAPLGATSSPEPSLSLGSEGYDSLPSGGIDPVELSKLLSENEQMNHALMALTSHFAQVQFRLGQVINAETDNREEMLQSLNEFASRGIPDLQMLSKVSRADGDTQLSNALNGKPQKLIEELRRQLDDLERFAYETGEQKDPPTQSVLEKQRLVLEELTARLELDINNLERLSDEELRQVVESAVHQFLNPVKINEKLVEQLKTQVVDLERFIDFLHGSGTCGEALIQALDEFKRTHQLVKSEDDPSPLSISDGPSETSAPGIQLGHSRHLNQDKTTKRARPLGAEAHRGVPDGQPVTVDKRTRDRTITVLQRALAILHIFTSTQFGNEAEDWLLKLRRNKNHCTEPVRNSATVERAKLHHWGTVRARLELAVNEVLEKVQLYHSYECKKNGLEAQYNSCIMQPIQTDGSVRPEQSGTPVSAEANRLARQLRRLQTYSVRSSCSGIKVGTDQDLPGTKIALPVQNLHGTSLRAMLNDCGGGRTDFPPSVCSTRYSRATPSTMCKIPTYWNGAAGDTEEFLKSEAQRMVIRAVRRQLCPALRDLIEHGLIKTALSTIHENANGAVQPGNFLWNPILGCFNSRRRRFRDALEDGLDPLPHPTDCEDPSGSVRSHRLGSHAWRVILKFYHMKNGQLYNQSPARKLSESFDLDSYGGKAITLRQRFFNAVGTVLESHTAYRRSDDSKFKAFVSIALNEGKLVPWLRLILKHQPLIESIYQPWSYTLSAGFDDALRSLDRLTDLGFNLPYDYSVRHLLEIRDAF
ncbi:RUN domain-containing protein [Fasciola gigantica]|uniref:RUN domain-containing protein n=1 Tax=Fasciola gigantica TaxID=46835 RepID=A0A504YT74_FASGI|nr:RUN domain-containing protein [Fasciola gigantica]